MDHVQLRWGRPFDHEALGEVMFDAVRNGPSPYSEAQRSVWVPEPRKGEEWDKRLSGQEIVVAECDGRVLGFMTLADHGYVDFAYLRPEARGAGLFGRMFEWIEKSALAKGEARLQVHASLMAEPAFLARGFTLVRRETVSVGGESLGRCEMEKILAPGQA